MKIAIVGATGEVGRMVLTCLREFDIQFSELDLYASASSAGKKILLSNSVESSSVKSNEYTIKKLSIDSMKQNYDYVFFTAGSSISKEYAYIAAESGATVIDNSSAFRQDKNIPLVVPEVNGEILKSYKGIVANPNCSTIQLMVVLKPLNDYKKINKVIVTTMQSVSGTGRTGIVELENQRNGLNEVKVYPRKIDMNVIPQIGEFETKNKIITNLNQGEKSTNHLNCDISSMKIEQYCQEELKMTFETRKILNIPDFNLMATTVRVPVIYGHSESVYVEFEDIVILEEIKQILLRSKAVKYDDNYITPLEIGNSNLSHVSRIRYAGDDNSLLFWNVANNVRLGAATNAVKILKMHYDLNSSLQN